MFLLGEVPPIVIPVVLGYCPDFSKIRWGPAAGSLQIYNKCLKNTEIENPFDGQFHFIVSMMDLDEVFSIPISLVATTTLAAVVILSIVVLIHGRKRSSYHPVGGSIFQQRKNMHRIQDFRIDVARKHKTYRFPGFLGSTSQVLTVDPVNVEYMLKTNFANYGKRWSNDIILIDLLGEGIFNVDGEKWHHQRKLTNYEFSTKTLRDFSNVVSKTNAIKLAHILADQAAASNRSIDIQVYIYIYMFFLA
ncbi:hypothetical protein EZV62_005727 [Acer yangbiense]|uniref:Cytochrome P450 n=1 Tax=Acer yangbiense TaxID=1000413 RepID=A0A5C7IR21_9ROSI|nr:hypothetical protein EZV62_005727 [Acer yangbiense]